MESVCNVTNIDSEQFQGMYGGEIRLLDPGETRPFPEIIAKHFADQLVTKILIRERKDYLTDPKRPGLLNQILGQAMAPAEKKPQEELEAKITTLEKALEEKEKEFEDLKRPASKIRKTPTKKGKK